MQYRQLGTTGLTVSTVGFSGNSIPRMPVSQARILLAGAMASGINLFDTSSGCGDSEPRIASAIKDRRDGVVLAARSRSLAARQIKSDVLRCCQRLGVDRIDLYQVAAVHRLPRLDAVLEPGGALDGLMAERDAGRIGHVGITGYNCPVLREALQRSDAFEAVQFPFNILEDGEPARALLAEAAERGVGVLAAKPLAGGILPQPVKALRWILNQPVSACLVGMVTADEVTANAAVADHPEPLTPPEEDELHRQVDVLAETFCRRCMECEPCPQGIPIYRILELGRKASLPQVVGLAREIYDAMEVRADACAECGECQDRCPFGLPVIDLLNEAHERLLG